LLEAGLPAPFQILMRHQSAVITYASSGLS